MMKEKYYSVDLSSVFDGETANEIVKSALSPLIDSGRFKTVDREAIEWALYAIDDTFDHCDRLETKLTNVERVINADAS